MNIQLYKTYQQVQRFIDEVCNIADQNRAAFGFLPRPAYLDLAVRNQLWIAYNTALKDLCGYVLFGISNSHLRIFQLYVSESYRNVGVGRRLLDDLKELAERVGLQVMTARVAADLPANSFWEKQGLRIIRQLVGGQTTNRTINVRAYEIEGSSLWVEGTANRNIKTPADFVLHRPVLSTPNFAIDLNVLFDVLKDRDHAELVRRMISDAFSSEIRLCVTSEFARELERHSAVHVRDPVLQLAKSLPTLPDVSPGVVAQLVTEIQSIVFPEQVRSDNQRVNDLSDLSHLASCVHHRITGFVTRDKIILRRAQVLLERYGVEVMSPADLLTGVSHSTAVPLSSHVNADVDGARVVISSMEESERGEIENFLKSQDVPDAALATILDPGSRQLPRTRLVIRCNADVVAVATWSIPFVPM